MKRPGYTVLMVKSETRDAIRQESEHSGLKMWAVVDHAVNEYLQKSGGRDLSQSV